jgi:hypothetical protein
MSYPQILFVQVQSAQRMGFLAHLLNSPPHDGVRATSMLDVLRMRRPPATPPLRAFDKTAISTAEVEIPAQEWTERRTTRRLTPHAASLPYCPLPDNTGAGARDRRAWPPDDVRSDNGSEFTSRCMLAWAGTGRSGWSISSPGGRCRTATSRASSGFILFRGLTFELSGDHSIQREQSRSEDQNQ